MKSLGNKWKNFKCSLKKKYVDAINGGDDVLNISDPRVDPTQWKDLVNFWRTEKSQEKVMVYLKSFKKSLVNVALATIESKDSLKKVGGCDLGCEYWEVAINVALVYKEPLPRPYGQFKTIGHAIGGFCSNSPSSPPETFSFESMASTGASRSVGGYRAEFLTVEQQVRFATVKIKLCGHKAVDVADLQKNGMGSIGEALNRLKWSKMATISDIMVPRSATFSTCTRADSDLMFWAIKNQEINMAELMIERMKFASAQVWDTKSKLNVSLPYAHLLTKIFQHYGISIVGDVSEKMGQAIRSRNLRKSGFSVVNGIWTKTSVAESEVNFSEPQKIQAAEPAAAASVEV
ncbi:hypothetical protein Taro_037350 [Colocasia esculenta]|uniref:Transposase Tnp1/En/Spm-like domain-containing protein n=1 Tax=Colocasia esculenta TaxID=4460 RepID=A0A843WPG1_COLES|nr:hypothetical protein [Colocasia esculenta]